MSFIVCPSTTTVFRVELLNVRVVLQHPDSNLTKCRVRGNFDNFRTINSPWHSLVDGCSSFHNYRCVFVYETRLRPLDILAAKLFAIEVYGKAARVSDDEIDPYIGQASIDLLTLAAGSQKCSLQLFHGDAFAGRISFELLMSEQTETLIWMHEIAIENCGAKQINLTKIQLFWQPIGEASDRVVEDGASESDQGRIVPFVDTVVNPSNHNRAVMRPKLPHSFPLTRKSLYGGAGMKFSVVGDGACCVGRDLGSATVIFADGIKDVDVENQVQSLTKTAGLISSAISGSPPAPPPPGAQAPPPDSSALSSITSGAINMFAKVLKDSERQFQKAVDFQVTTTGGEDCDGEQFMLSGRMWLSTVPEVGQMQGGMTVDGVVCGGQPLPGQKILPPFTDTDDSGV